MMRSATDLSKADLHVFSKLFDDGLERGQEAKAFSWRQIGGHDDVLDFFVGHLITVEMTRQPAPSSAVGVFDAAFLPGGIGVAEPRASQNPVVMVRMERSKACCAKAVSFSNVTDLRRAGWIRPNTASLTEMVSAAVVPASRVARVTRDFRSCRTRTGRVRLPMMRSPSP